MAKTGAKHHDGTSGLEKCWTKNPQTGYIQ